MTCLYLLSNQNKAAEKRIKNGFLGGYCIVDLVVIDTTKWILYIVHYSTTAGQINVAIYSTEESYSKIYLVEL